LATAIENIDIGGPTMYAPRLKIMPMSRLLLIRPIMQQSLPS